MQKNKTITKALGFITRASEIPVCQAIEQTRCKAKLALGRHSQVDVITTQAKA